MVSINSSSKYSSRKNALLGVILEEYYYNHVSLTELSLEKCLPKTTLYRWIRKFETENPQMAEQMKKQGKEVTPEDYKNLLREIAELKKSLAQEKLRADFYEEMVAFGKEVYGIDLKKLAPSSRKASHTGRQALWHRPDVSSTWCKQAGLLQARGQPDATSGSGSICRGICERNPHEGPGYWGQQALEDVSTTFRCKESCGLQPFL